MSLKEIKQELKSGFSVFLTHKKRQLLKLKNSIVNLPKNFVESLTKTVVGMRTAIVNAPHNLTERAISINHHILTTPKRWHDKFVKLRHMTLKDIKELLIKNAILISLIGIVLFLVGSDPEMFFGTGGWDRFMDILKASSSKWIIALGVGTIIVARGTDLSAGRAVGLSALVTALFSQRVLTYGNVTLGLESTFIVAISMSIGALVGLVNGVLVAKLNLDPFIATLALMLILYGVNMNFVETMSGGSNIGSFNDKYSDLTGGEFEIGSITIPYIVLIALGTAGLVSILWTKTPFGKKLFAVGGNPKAAAVSGIGVAGILIITYMLGGMMYGVAASIDTWRSGSAGVGTGFMYELDAIAACIVGGLSFTGGKGKVSGIILGVLIFQIILYGFTRLGFGSSMSNIIKGCIIAFACAFDMLKNKIKK